MRRGTEPPTQQQRELASVVVDALIEKRFAEIVDDIAALMPVAIAEYLRLFPMTRNVNNHVWLVTFNNETQEKDLCCFFCRESLNTLPWRQSIPHKMDLKCMEHGQLCAMRLLAGHIEGVGPHGEAPVKPKAPPKPRQKRCNACDGDGRFITGGACAYCNGEGRVAIV